MVGVRGFEPPTPASRTQYSTRLSYTPRQIWRAQYGLNPCLKNYRETFKETSFNAVKNYGQPRKPLIVAKLIWILNQVMQKLHHLPSELPAARLRGCIAGRAYP